MGYTITEALADLKLIKNKADKKAAFAGSFIGRQEGVKDPNEKSGGSAKVIAEELQAIDDLHERHVRIRSAIAAANSSQTVTIGTTTRTVADWLVWRRDVAPMQKQLQSALEGTIAQIRATAKKNGVNTVGTGLATQPQDVVIEIDEKRLAEKGQRIQEILDTLDGRLSLHNATVQVEV